MTDDLDAAAWHSCGVSRAARASHTDPADDLIGGPDSTRIPALGDTSKGGRRRHVCRHIVWCQCTESWQAYWHETGPPAGA